MCASKIQNNPQIFSIIALVNLLVFFALFTGCGKGIYSYYERAEELSQSGQYEQAIEIYHQALAKDAKNATLLNNLAVLHYRKGDLASAAKRFEQCLKLTPSDDTIRENLANVYIVLAKDYEKRGDYVNAKDAYEKTLIYKPGNALIYYELCLLALQEGQLEQARNYLQRLEKTATTPQLTKLAKTLFHRSRASAYERRQNWRGAIGEYQEVLQVNPEDLASRYQIALLYVHRGEYNRAISVLKDLSSVAPDGVELQYEIGLLYRKQGDIENAIASLEGARQYASVKNEAENSLKDIYASLAVEQERIEKFDTAANYYEKVLSISPREAKLHYKLGHLYEKLGRTQDAIASFQSARKLHPQDVRILNDLGVIHYQDNQPKRTIPVENGVAPKSVNDFKKFVRETAAKHKVELSMLMALMKAESTFDPYQVSKAGAAGLMQLMPETAGDMGLKVPQYGNIKKPNKNPFIDERFDPVKSIDAGTRYLRMMLTMFDNQIDAIAAYNWGPGNVQRKLKKWWDTPDADETLRYVYKVTRQKERYELSPKSLETDLTTLARNCTQPIAKYNALRKQATAPTLYVEDIIKQFQAVKDNNTVLLNLGRIYEAEGKYQEATNCYEQILAQKPHQQIYLSLGNTYLRQNRYDDAIKAFERGLAGVRSPSNGNAGLGIAFCATGKYKEAIPYLQRAVQTADRNPDIHSSLGVACLKAGRVNSAEVAFKKAMDLDKQHTIANNGLITTLLAKQLPPVNLRRIQSNLFVLPFFEKKSRHVVMLSPIHGRITSRFGWRIDPIGKKKRQFHNGIDIATPMGTPVKAPLNGIALKTYRNNASGNVIILRHDGGYQTDFRHLSKIRVKEGQSVRRGDIIGEVGETGWRTTGAHLHFGVMKDGKYVDPLNFLLR